VIVCHVLRGRWCDIFNVHAPFEGTSGYSKDSFYKELEQLLGHFRIVM